MLHTRFLSLGHNLRVFVWDLPEPHGDNYSVYWTNKQKQDVTILRPIYTSTLNRFQSGFKSVWGSCVNAPNAKLLYVNHIMMWLKLNRFETSLSASVNGALMKKA